jgi:hypothetical protein
MPIAEPAVGRPLAGERVLLALEAWKEMWALRMLGMCYRMCILLFTEKRFIELETDVLEKVVPSYTPPYGGAVTEIEHPLDLLWNWLLNELMDVVWEKTGMKTRIWARKREREEAMKALSGDDLDEVLRFIRGYLAPRMKIREMRDGLVAHYAELDRIKARKRGSTLRLEVAWGGRKLRYEIPFSDEELARLVKERLGALGLPNLEVR